MNNQTSKWLIYVVALLSGLTLGSALVYIAWNSAVADNKREFIFESSKVRETVTHNIQVSNDFINSIATFIYANKEFDNDIFQSTAEGILSQQPFMEGMLYSPFESPYSKDDLIPDILLKTKSYRFRDPEISIDEHYIGDDTDYQNIFKSLLLNETNEPVVSVVKFGNKQYYVLFKTVLNEGYQSAIDDEPEKTIQGIFTLLINPEKLFNNSVLSEKLSLYLHSESTSLNGRQLIYQKTALDRNRSFHVTTFEEDVSIQLPSYSVKMSIHKKVYWNDIDQSLIYIAFLLGIGITLLLIALVRAKDLREKELSERNIVVEQKVEEQTKELALARDKALEASQMKSDFLASMSHEIRTPLTAIIGMAELLSDTKLSNDQEKYVKVFRKAGDTLLSLVNDILDLSKIEAEQLVLENITYDLLEVIEESVEIYAIKAAENNVEIVSHIDPKIDMKRVGDPSRLRQIILNLISNAIKFTNDGYIVVSVKAMDKDEVEISVKDTGVGIPQEKQEAIFASFTQADSSTTRKYGGTGLGLTISKRLVEMMDGSIGVESVEGEGSTFFFRIHSPVNESATRSNLPIANFLNKKKIYLFDNNPHNKTKIKAILDSFSATCVDEPDLTELLSESNPPEKDINELFVFMDYKTILSMGEDELSKFNDFKERIKTIAILDPVSHHQQVNKINELGFHSYLTKPIKQAELLHVFSSKTDKAQADEKTLENNESNDVFSQEKRVLLVEDNPDNRLLVKTYLKKLPIVIDEAENGEVAVNLFKENTYNLVLMDVQMPVMDGHEATRAMRVLEAESGQAVTPIIALTAHAIKEEIDKCIAAGCDTHVGKPIKKSILISVIEDYAT